MFINVKFSSKKNEELFYVVQKSNFMLPIKLCLIVLNLV